MKKKFRKKGWSEFAPAVLVGDDIPEAAKQLKVFKNNLYQVLVDGSNAPEYLYLSIKRLDKAPIHDWRHLQRIKNEICGPEWEAVELYPAESRLIDEANQYHLWAYPQKLNIGYHQGRQVSGPKEAIAVGARQRAF